MNTSDRKILHLDLDTFFVSVERLLNSHLINKPIIVGGTSERGVVAACSYETRNYGVHSGMPMKMARILCGEAIIIRGDIDTYSKYSNLITDIIAENAPVYEKASIDEHYVDLTGLDRFFGCYTWSKELRQLIIKNSGLPISFGLSQNKTVSKIATGESKPNGELQITKNDVRGFLNPLSIKKIPGIGNKTYQMLRQMGIISIQNLSSMPMELMEKVLGKNGLNLWKKANGIDNTPVKPYSERKSISTEQTFQQDTIDIAKLNNLITLMIEKLAFQLRQKQRLTSCVTIKIRYSNFDTHTLQKRISYTSLDHTLINISKELFKRLYKRRMLIRLLGIKFSYLVQGVQQLNLFEDSPEMVRLYLTLDKLKNKYYPKIIGRASGMNCDQ